MPSAVRSKRPSPAERRASILEAAAAVFFEHGFSASSVDMIIDRIGGSKRTIYNEFGNKESLFISLVTELADEALADLQRIKEARSGELREALLLLTTNLLSIYSSEKLIGVYRVVITEAHRFPMLARMMYEKGPGRAAKEAKIILDAALAQGEIRRVDTAVAADHFIGLMRDNLHLQVVLGLRRPAGTEERNQRAAFAVDLFLHGIALPGCQAGPRGARHLTQAKPTMAKEPSSATPSIGGPKGARSISTSGAGRRRAHKP